MGIVGRLDQYASMLAGEFDDYSMSENLLLRSEEFNNAYWTKVASSITQNSVVAPDGLSTADTLIEDTSSNSHAVVRNVTKPTSAITYTLSLFAKLKDTRNIQIILGASDVSGLAGVTVNLSTGVISSGPTTSGTFSNTSAKVQSYPNGWYRIALTTTSNTVTPITVNIYTVNGISASYTGDGTSGIYLWGAQLEESPAATDYTPTTTTAKTRVLPSTTNTNITGLSTYFSSGFSENVGVSTFLPANVFPPYDLVYDEFGGTFFGAGQGRYKRQNTDKSVVVYNEIDEVTDFRDIVRTGLVLDLDAAQPLSYKGTGTTWNDLSGLGNNGTLENSPSYSAANGGSLSFNGTTQRVVCGNATNLQITVGTISAWFNANNGNSGYNGIITKRDAWGLFVRDNLLVAYDWGNNLERSTGITVGNSTWNYVAMSFTESAGTPSNNAIIYLNGSSVLTTTVKNLGQGFQVMVAEADFSQYFGGNIANAQIYNRALTATEITKNYNALKHRFGL